MDFTYITYTLEYSSNFLFTFIYFSSSTSTLIAFTTIHVLSYIESDQNYCSTAASWRQEPAPSSSVYWTRWTAIIPL